MDNVRVTSPTLANLKKEKEHSFQLCMNSFQSQLKKTRVDSMHQLEMNIVPDSLAQHSSNLIFLKTEKYEGSKWVTHT